MYTVYILRCRDGTLYTGITTDVVRRLAEHTKGIGGRYTRSRGVVNIVYTERKKNRSTASKREAEIKRLSRNAKRALIISTSGLASRTKAFKKRKHMV